MTELELLYKALHSSATIQQPHGVKAYLAAKHLYKIFNQSNIWQQTALLIDQTEIYSAHSFSNAICSTAFSQQKIQSILLQGIYPAAYAAFNQWYLQKGFADIFQYYLKQAAYQNVYLSHHITLLFAFDCLFPNLNQDNIALFIDCMTEFVTATFTHTISSSSLETLKPSLSIDLKILLTECLKRPGFFCHHLITLVWLIRYQSKLKQDMFEIFKYQLFIQATQPFDDIQDELDLEIYHATTGGTKERFYDMINQLIYTHRVNLHQITLADALVYLQAIYPAYTSDLTRIAEYQTQHLSAG